MAEGGTLANDRLVVGVSPRGGALTMGETRDGRPFLRGAAGPVDDVREMACFPLVPVANRVALDHLDLGARQIAFHPNTDDPFYLHGDGWLSDWKVTDRTATEVRLSLEKAAPGAGPHLYLADQHVALDGNRLRIALTVTNRGDGPMPFGLGLHPYFPRAGALVSFSATGWWTEGAGHLPLAREPVPAAADFTEARPLPDLWLNNAYEGWTGRATVRWPSTGLAVELAADPVFGTLMVYAPDNDHSFFCLEPMSHLPNALGLISPGGMHMLAPGESLSGSVTFTVTQSEPIP